MRPPEEVRRRLVRDWLEKADEDLGAAHVLAAQDRPFLFTVAFHV